MTTADGLPIGRKLRIAGDCPSLCATPPVDHAEHGNITHFGADQIDPTGSLGLYASTFDDGATWSVQVGLMEGANTDWRWTVEQAQQFVEQLQTVLATMPGLLRRPDQLPTARETVALALLQQLEPHPATHAGRALEVLARVREPEDVASVAILGEIQTLHALIEQGKQALENTSDTVTAEHQLAFRSVVHLEQQRRALMAQLAEAPA